MKIEKLIRQILKKNEGKGLDSVLLEIFSDGSGNVSILRENDDKDYLESFYSREGVKKTLNKLGE